MAGEKRGKKKLRVGKDAVVMGNVPGDANVGDGSVVIGPTDSRGNVVLNQPMAVGHGAHAGPGSIAIGAGAGAGFDIVRALREVKRIVRSTGDATLIQSVDELQAEVASENKDKSTITKLWDIVKRAAVLVEKHPELLAIISGWINNLG